VAEPSSRVFAVAQRAADLAVKLGAVVGGIAVVVLVLRPDIQWEASPVPVPLQTPFPPFDPVGPDFAEIVAVTALDVTFTNRGTAPGRVEAIQAPEGWTLEDELAADGFQLAAGAERVVRMVPEQSDSQPVFSNAPPQPEVTVGEPEMIPDTERILGWAIGLGIVWALLVAYEAVVAYRERAEPADSADKAERS
jgi:hypothetical protein